MKKLTLALALLLSLISCDSCTTGPQPDTEIHVIRSRNGHPLVWDQISYPIRLDVDESFSVETVNSILTAVDAWESIAQRDLFLVSLTSDEIAIMNPAGGHVTLTTAILSDKIEGKHLGETRPYTVGGSKTIIHSMTVEVDVALLNPEYSDLFYSVVLHELGHVLLIHHDWDPQSIMFKDVSESALIIQPKHVKHIQDRFGPVLML